MYIILRIRHDYITTKKIMLYKTSIFPLYLNAMLYMDRFLILLLHVFAYKEMRKTSCFSINILNRENNTIKSNIVAPQGITKGIVSLTVDV